MMINIIISVIMMIIMSKQVNLKINNLNIEDIFDWQRMERLKKVFQNNLWQESHQVVVTTVKMTMLMMMTVK